MEPNLTAEQIERGKKFTPEEQQRYNRARISGSDASTAFAYALGSAPAAPARDDGIFTGENSLSSAFSRAGTTIAEGAGRVAGDVASIDPMQLITNPRGALSRPFLRGTATVVRAVDDILGGVVETADDVFTGGQIGRSIYPTIERAAQSAPGQAIISTLTRADDALDNIPGDILAASELLLPPGISIAGRSVARRRATNAAERGATAAETFAGAIQTTRPLRDFIPSRVRESFAGTAEAIQDTVVPGRRAAGTLERARQAGVENIDEVILRNATDRGFGESDSVLFSTLSGKDLDAARKMFEITEQVDANPLMTARAADVIGENLVQPIKALRAAERAAGKDVDLAAKALKGQSVSGTNIQSRIQEILEEAGIGGNPSIWNFSGSRFEFVPEVQNRIAKTLDNVYLALQDGDALAVHNLKKAIDEAVDYAKTQEGLTGSGQALIKSIRRAIDDELDTTFPEYNAANSKFADLRDILEETETLFSGADRINAARANSLVRSLFSNNLRRGEIESYIQRLDDYLNRYGIDKPGNLVAQFRFAEALERMYGTQAITSLQGEVKKAIQGAQTAANIVRDPIRGAGEVLAGSIETLTGQTDAARRAFLRGLFSAP